jgi:GTPase SAR1 family protein
MSEKSIQRLTGTILSLGDGAVGKTTLTMLLTDEMTAESVTRKTKNLEFEFFCDNISTDQMEFRINQQFFTPPGQKECEGDKTSRSFEEIIEIYRDLISIPQVILLVYDLANMESFHNLEYWVEQAIQLMDEKTEFILVGTHLDEIDLQEVDQELIFNGIRFIEQSIRTILPEWLGLCQHIEISGKTTANLAALRRLISQNILRIRGFNILEDSCIEIHQPSKERTGEV